MITTTETATPAKISVIDWKVEDADHVDPFDMRVTVCLNCVSGQFSDKLAVVVVDEWSMYQVGYFYSPLLSLEENQTETFTFSGSIGNVIHGSGYAATLFLNNQRITPNLYSFTIGESGIESVNADPADEAWEYFNLQGTRIHNPATGLYIRSSGNRSEKIYIKQTN